MAATITWLLSIFSLFVAKISALSVLLPGASLTEITLVHVLTLVSIQLLAVAVVYSRLGFLIGILGGRNDSKVRVMSERQ